MTELAQIARLMARLRLRAPERRTRRRRPARSGDPDLRRTLRRAMRTGGEPIERAWRRRRVQRRRLLLVLDVSGSMSTYSRSLALFAHASLRAGPGDWEAFAFGTRLTRMTRALSVADADVAIAAAAAEVADWDGGTRIGASLKRLIDEHGRTRAVRGATCVILSDGLDVGDPELLGEQMARLSRLAHRVVWLNPLKGHDAYEPLARGMASRPAPRRRLPPRPQPPEPGGGRRRDRPAVSSHRLPPALVSMIGFLPWIVYWILVGNVSFTTSILVTLGVAVAVNAATYARTRSFKLFEAGAIAIFVALLIVSLVGEESFLERWIQPLSNLGILVLALATVAVGRPFTLEYARESVPPEVQATAGFDYVNRLLTWVWIGAFAVMTLVSFIPPIVQGEATIRDGASTLSIVCYWVIPFSVLALAGIVTAKFPDWLVGSIDRQLAPAERAPRTPAPPAAPVGEAHHGARGSRCPRSTRRSTRRSTSAWRARRPVRT